MAKVVLKGLKETLTSIRKFGDEVEKEIHIITGDTATQIELEAKQKASLDFGDLRQGIKAVELEKASFKVYTNYNGNAPYSAYVEFGTGTRVKVPEEMQEMAIKFIGKGVKEVNLQARPFLYPAFVQNREKYLEELKDMLIDLTKKYD